ncbi:hypothetical protein Glove_206g14 [Diversispora epigaea]|uniref:Uncharacterized protein n=1 Tax=Diversispora epigaea TaxID=1348612 RepID=A0A397ISZ8_9GLOM|nr:hypothetical protein Glove_206g14 [Diversispora epigaea]
MAFVYTAKLFDFDLSESMIEQNKKDLNLDKKMIKGFEKFIDCLKVYLNILNIISAEGCRIKIYSSVTLKNGTILHTKNDFHHRPWFSNIAVNMNEEELSKYLSDKGICYAQTLLITEIRLPNKSPMHLALVQWYDFIEETPFVYGCPLLRLVEMYNFIEIEAIEDTIHVVPRFDKNNEYFTKQKFLPVNKTATLTKQSFFQRKQTSVSHGRLLSLPFEMVYEQSSSKIVLVEIRLPNKSPMHLALVQWYDFIEETPFVYGCPLLRLVEVYNFIEIEAIEDTIHVVPRFDKNNEYFVFEESTTPIIIESGGEEPETRATKRRRTEKGREEQYSEGENESTLARKKKEDRTLNYLVKIDKEVGDLRKEVSDIRKIMENSKMMKESDEIYDQTFINKIIGEIANKTISKKIYPNSKKLKEISARFLANKYPELFENWSNKRWTFYFDMILQRKLVERHWSRRGALSTQIRKSIFSVFRSLPKINMKSTPSEIKAWKSLSIVKQCYEKLHSKLENDETTWCGKIINETWQDTSKVSKEQISFVVAICESFLNPNNEILKNDNKFLSKRLKRNLKIIGEIANKTISKKIYPNSKKLKEISARFLANKYPELFENWSNKRWTFYFDMILQRKLVERHWSRRGALSTQIRKSIFSVFRSLPKINMKSTPSEIKAWKSLSIVKQCYEKLHSKLENDETTWCGKIINETWQDTSKVSKEQISFVVAICESFLNPNNEILKNDNKFLSKRLKRNLKKMETGREFDLKDSDSNEETESDSSTSDEDEDEDEDEGEVSRNEGEGSGERSERERSGEGRRSGERRSKERNEERRSEERERRSRERSEERNEERERRSEEREGRRSEEREGRRSGEKRSVGRSVERRNVERRSEERRSEREEKNEWE